ncbi:hypothetical protein EP10_000149 [Geobacillus icigianus]|uniref:Uncharacterized protein n=1 Tax=Geobacillus icigianus TaxID=1430331 RepID=A0ABU6BBX1_9BACL|nr:hypothetical protein [Geobacillus icigianus]
MEIRLIPSIPMTRDGIVVEPRRLQPWPNPLRLIDVMHPLFPMNERLPGPLKISRMISLTISLARVWHCEFTGTR